jgi:nanoRNase/pAp phosphatase (c-di-AMP/oligoRNAs hydrolase)
MCKDLEQFKESIVTLKKSRIAIVMHENPDPDSIASALGLEKILLTWNLDVKCTFLYSGEISHAQNKTMVNVLNIVMSDISEVDLKEEFDVFITVDVLPDRCLDKDIPCLMSIDHHRADTKRSQFTDIRPVGATSSIIWDYMQKEDIKFKKNDEKDAIIATALLMGIKTDTSDLVSENITDLDFQAYRDLLDHVNQRHLSAIISYPIPPHFFELRSNLDQEENVKSDGGVFVGGVGYISSTKRDALPALAEERARVEGIETAFVFGIVGENIEVSVRSVGLSVDVNALCQKLFGKQYAGGKMGAGAAKIPLGFMALDPNVPVEVRDKVWEAVKERIIDKIFHVVKGNE